jgi:hypothetical protein
VIRFSAALVVIALGILVAGDAVGKLLLVYVAIAVSALSLVCFAIGVLLKRGELFGAPARLAPGYAGPASGFASAGERYSPADEQAGFASHEAPRPPGRKAPGRKAPARSPGASTPPRGAHASPRRQPAPSRPDTDELSGPRVGAGFGAPSAYSGPAGSGPGQGHRGRDSGPDRREQARGSRHQQESARTPRTAADRPPPPWRPDTGPQEWSQHGGTPAAPAAPAEGPARGQGSGGFGTSTPPPAYTEPSLVRPWADPPSARPQRPVSGQPPEWSERPSARPEPPRAEPPWSEPPRQEPPWSEPAWSEPLRPEPAWSEPSQPEPPLSEPVHSEDPRPEEPAAFWDDSTTSSGPGTDDIPPPVAPIYPDRDKPREPDVSAVEEPAPAEPEPAVDSGWFAGPQTEADEEEAPSGPVDDAESAEDDEPVTSTESVADSSEAVAEPVADEEPAAEEDAPSEQEAEPDEPADDVAATSEAPADREVTVVPGVPRYHRGECILIRFMGEEDLETMTLHSAEESGCTACRACQPDKTAEDAAAE